MVELGKTLDVASAAEWRAWLEQHHETEPEIWIVYHSKASGEPSISYNEAVDEAICFGWIDSTVKKHGPHSRAQRFTRRRPGSRLSEMNKTRFRRLHAAGKVTQAGIEAAGDILNEPFEIPADILSQLQSDPETRRNFEAFPESYRRIRVAFIEGARNRPAIFERRLAYFLKMTKANKRYGMVQ
jgi:uncharacterized protein YdeI (YjbR/CyaY-like superfamily)